jgi:hypothetical protein
MWRSGEVAPGMRFMRGGSLDDMTLVEGVLKPTLELFTADRVGWFKGMEGAEQL